MKKTLTEKCENDGCTENKSEKHSEICPFRKVSCILLQCDGLSPFNRPYVKKSQNDGIAILDFRLIT